MDNLNPPPTGRMKEILESVSPEAYERIVEHLLGGTPAAPVVKALNEEGYKIGLTTYKEYRRKLQEGVCDDR